MALGPPITISLAATPASQHNTYPASVFGPWATAIDAGGLDEADSGVTRPDQFTISSRKIIRPFANTRGTSLVFAAFYASGDTANTGGTYAVWGRNNDEQAWTRLENRAGSITSTPAYAPTTDASNGTLSITVPDALNDIWDCIGFSEFIVGITTGYTATGDATAAGLFVKAL